MGTPRIRVAGGSPQAQAAGDKRAKAGPTAAVTRAPTVQRMR
jgi:hypothetical protein